MKPDDFWLRYSGAQSNGNALVEAWGRFDRAEDMDDFIKGLHIMQTFLPSRPIRPKAPIIPAIWNVCRVENIRPRIRVVK